MRAQNRQQLREGPSPHTTRHQLLPYFNIERIIEQVVVKEVPKEQEVTEEDKKEVTVEVKRGSAASKTLPPKETLPSDWSQQQVVATSFVVVPQQHSAADGYNQYRTPTGCIRTTITGQAIEFFDRVYVPPSSCWIDNRIWLSPCVTVP
jgi:hypothetical protein